MEEHTSAGHCSREEEGTQREGAGCRLEEVAGLVACIDLRPAGDTRKGERGNNVG